MNQSICPLCGQYNRCQASTANGCWCMAAKHMDRGVPKALIEKANQLGSEKSCICQKCIQTHEDKTGK